jgi:hypothetical protein
MKIYLDSGGGAVFIILLGKRTLVVEEDTIPLVYVMKARPENSFNKAGKQIYAMIGSAIIISNLIMNPLPYNIFEIY